MSDLLLEYVKRGFNLVPIPPGLKAPNTKSWNDSSELITSVEQYTRMRKTKSRKLEGNIGVHLLSSQLCSFDVDDMDLTRKALAVVGLDPEKILKAGWLVRGNPARGRAIFSAPQGLTQSHKLIKTFIGPEGKPIRRTIFELRGFASHEQDVLPPSIHPDTKKPYTSSPLPEGRPPEPPKEFINFWHEFDKLLPSLLRAVESEPRYDKYGGQHLRHSHDYSGHFNKMHDVVEILERNGYDIKRMRHGLRARHPNSTSGGFSARQIPGTADLWQSDNGNDPLYGLFDAWCAFVDLEHGGDVEAAAKAWKPKKLKPEIKPTKEMTKNDINFLEDIFTAEEIIAADIPKPVYRVENLFPPGVYLLAGDIKLGKSYLMAQACLAIATGAPLLTCKTRKCKALMLDLEGAPSLLKTRLEGMPKALQLKGPLNGAVFRLTWPKGIEAVEMLDAMLEQDPEIRFVVIDTLARIRDDTGAKGNQYNLDYDSVAPWADLRKKYHDLTIIIIHHVRKMTADDAHEMVSGTFGLGGAVDGTFVLLRPNRTGSSRVSESDKPALKNLAEFYGRTRYGEDISWVLERKSLNPDQRDAGFVWEQSAVKPWEILLSIEHNKILEVMRQQPEKVWTAKEIAEELGKRPNTVGNQLHTMAKRGLVEPLTGVGFKLPAERERKF